jgi:transposase InsO family protein
LPATIRPNIISSLRSSILIQIAALSHPDCRATALARHGRPKIFNTDRGSQFTSAAFTGLLVENGIAVRMDGRGALA